MKSKHFRRFGTSAMVLLITACFIPAIAGAFEPGDGRHDKGFEKKNHQRPALGIWRNPQMVQKLELTENQTKQIRDADFTFREKHLALKTQLDGLRLKMDKAFSDDVVDDTTVLKMAEKIAAVKAKLFIQKIEGRLALRKILNAEQIKKLNMHEMCQEKNAPRRGKKHISRLHSAEKPGDKKRFDN